MPQVGIALPDEFRETPLSRTVEFARRAEDAGFDAVWKGETSGSNGFMVLAAVAQHTDSIRLGTGIANVFSRSPSLLGMSAVTLGELSEGRAVLGLGVSTKPIVEDWHGIEYRRPLRRLRETIEILRQVMSGGTVEYDGDVFTVGPYTMELEHSHGTIPIFNAAMGSTNRKLTGEFADGWMPVFVPLSELESQATAVQSAAEGRERDVEVTVAPWVPTAVAEDPDRAEQLAREHLAQEMGMGYNRIAAQYDFGAAPDEAHEHWRDGDREAAAAAISEEMLDELALYGTPESCREQLDALFEAGAHEVILWPPFTATDEERLAVVEALGPASR